MRFSFLFILLILPFVLYSQTILEADFIRNYDGDTFTAFVKIPSKKRFYDYDKRKLKCRLFRCDTYEIKDGDPHNRELAQAAKYFTQEKLSQNDFRLVYKGKDWHGRHLFEVLFEDGKTLKQLLKQKGLLTGKYENSPERSRIFNE